MPTHPLFFLQIRYTGYRDRPLQERQIRFKNSCLEGHCDFLDIVSFVRLHFSLSSRLLHPVDPLALLPYFPAHSHQAFVSTGTNINLLLNTCTNGYTGDSGCSEIMPLTSKISFSCETFQRQKRVRKNRRNCRH